MSIENNDHILSEEEKEILDSYEVGELQSIENLEKERIEIKRAAKATLKKDRRINIRITSRSLEELQTIAIQEGIPYQTLISSILHKYINGRFVEQKHR